MLLREYGVEDNLNQKVKTEIKCTAESKRVGKKEMCHHFLLFSKPFLHHFNY